MLIWNSQSKAVVIKIYSYLWCVFILFFHHIAINVIVLIFLFAFCLQIIIYSVALILLNPRPNPMLKVHCIQLYLAPIQLINGLRTDFYLDVFSLGKTPNILTDSDSR